MLCVVTKVCRVAEVCPGRGVQSDPRCAVTEVCRGRGVPCGRWPMCIGRCGHIGHSSVTTHIGHLGHNSVTTHIGHLAHNSVTTHIGHLGHNSVTTPLGSDTSRRGHASVTTHPLKGPHLLKRS